VKISAACVTTFILAAVAVGSARLPDPRTYADRFVGHTVEWIETLRAPHIFFGVSVGVAAIAAGLRLPRNPPRWDRILEASLCSSLLAIVVLSLILADVPITDRDRTSNDSTSASLLRKIAVVLVQGLAVLAVMSCCAWARLVAAQCCQSGRGALGLEIRRVSLLMAPLWAVSLALLEFRGVFISPSTGRRAVPLAHPGDELDPFRLTPERVSNGIMLLLAVGVSWWRHSRPAEPEVAGAREGVRGRVPDPG
jgi:hypothetical protein